MRLMRLNVESKSYKRPYVMHKNRSLIIVGAVLLSAALAAILISSNKNSLTTTQPSPVANSDVWVYDCEIPEQRPELLMLTCASGGMRVEKIIWSTWSSNGAVGYGTYLENDCKPDCSQGSYDSVPVYFTLSETVVHKGEIFLKTLEITPEQGQELPRGQQKIKWDLFEFGEMMSKE